jgi:ABC-type dipeptide/oligopeptide/nickel transport system ATPase subunit
MNKIRTAIGHPQFITDVMKPMLIEQIFDQVCPGVFVLCLEKHVFFMLAVLFHLHHFHCDWDLISPVPVPPSVSYPIPLPSPPPPPPPLLSPSTRHLNSSPHRSTSLLHLINQSSLHLVTSSQEVAHLSGGEMQRVALVLALGKPADIYLIDEPSAYLDSEQRIVAAKVIKRYGKKKRNRRQSIFSLTNVSIFSGANHQRNGL